MKLNIKITIILLASLITYLLASLLMLLFNNQKSNELNLKCNETCNNKGYFSGKYNSTDCICYYMSDQKMVTKYIEMS